MDIQNDSSTQDELYYVVINLEEQYSIWPSYKKIPMGWEPVGSAKTKVDCLKFIEEHWTDMRPLSLRKKMEQVSES